jgi:hypothetical protein
MPPTKDIKEELEQLQLEEARAQAEERKQRRESLHRRAVAIEETIKRDNQNRVYLQSLCQHRKGGRGAQGFYTGNDANYAVITHHCSHGKTIVICQRCGRLWEAPAPLKAKATAEEKAKYRADLAEFRRAQNLPTDNEPSGSVLFTVQAAEDELTP